MNLRRSQRLLKSQDTGTTSENQKEIQKASKVQTARSKPRYKSTSTRTLRKRHPTTNNNNSTISATYRRKTISKNQKKMSSNQNIPPTGMKMISEAYSEHMHRLNTEKVRGLAIHKSTPLSESVLPAIYPSYFADRGVPIQTELKTDYKYNIPYNIPYWDISNTCNNLYLTPELTQNVHFDDDITSSPSLPDSLRGVFETDDLREILQANQIMFRLTAVHLKVLAIVLNIKIEFLSDVLEKILSLESNILEKVELALNREFRNAQ